MVKWDRIIGNHPALGIIPATLRDVAHLRQFVKGETLYRQGDQPEAILYVLQGEVGLVRYLQNGEEIILQRSRGGFLAEASLDVEFYHCDVVTASNGRLLMFPRSTFQTALDTEPVFNRAWIGFLAREVRDLRTRSERLSSTSASERILHYIETEGVEGMVTLTQSRKAWAGELGLSHEALYRTLKELRARGVLAIDGRQISRSSR